MNKNGKRKHAALFIMKLTLLQIFLSISLVSYTFAKDANGQEVLDRKVSVNLPAEEMKVVLKKQFRHLPELDSHTAIISCRRKERSRSLPGTKDWGTC